MCRYILRRALQIIPVLLGISVIVFLIISLLPGDFLDSRITETRMSSEQIEHLRDLYDVNEPIHIRYIKWIKGAVTGDFGDSFTYHRPVVQVIGTYMWNSFILAAVAFILQIIIAVPLGILSALKQHSATDTAISVISLAGISIPSFFLGYLLIKIFAIDLKILPFSGFMTPGADYTGIAAFADLLKHLIMPVFVLVFASAGSLMRYIRSSFLGVLSEDYILTARAKGLSNRAVVFKHAFKNAMIPIVTLIGAYLPHLFTGAIITESIFGIPGIGKIALEAMTKRDYPLLMGFCMFIALITLLGNLIADILYAVVDPRVKLER